MKYRLTNENVYYVMKLLLCSKTLQWWRSSSFVMECNRSRWTESQNTLHYTTNPL